MGEGRFPVLHLHRPLIRRYIPRDRGAVRDLAIVCADQRIFPSCLSRHHGLVSDVLTRYYLDFEPESCWVADDPDNGIVGYLFGCLSTARRCRVMASRIMPAVILRAVLTGAAFSCPVGRLAGAGLRSWLRGRPVKSQSASAYPAHLHVGVHEDCRRHRLGEELVRHFVAQARNEGIPGIHVSIVKTNLAARMLFQDLKFDVLGQYEAVFPGSPQVPVRMLLLGLQISSPADPPGREELAPREGSW